MNNNLFPFTEEKISDNVFIRTFTENITNDELVWHRDHENRIIEVIQSNGWKLQIDNCLPQSLNNGSTIAIEACIWHRIIKGDGNLIIKITKL